MKHTIKNNKLKKILEERGRVLNKAKKIQREVEKLQKEQQKLGYRMNRLKEKTEPLVEGEKEKFVFEEFDYIARVAIEKDNVIIEIKNQIEDYKELLREKK